MGVAPSRPVRDQTASGVIETLGNAFTIVNRRPYLIGFIVLLDAFLWLGPRLAASDLTASLADALARAGALPPEETASLRSLGDGFDLLLLGALFLPSLLTSLGPQSIALPFSPVVIRLTAPEALAVAAGAFSVGTIVSMAYWTLLAGVVRGERFHGRRYGRAVVRNTGVLLAYLGLLMLVLLGLGFTASLGLLSAAVIGLEAVALQLLTFALLVAGIAFYFGTFFVEDAIVMSGAGPFRAIAYSLGIFRVAFGSALRFVFAVTIIQLGLPLALRVFVENALAVPFAILSYAYVATGLTVASLLFYRERIVHVLRREGSRARAERDRRPTEEEGHHP